MSRTRSLFVAATLALLADAGHAQNNVTISPAVPALDTTPDVYRGTGVLQSNAPSVTACADRIKADAATRAPGTYTYGCQPGRTSITVTVSAPPPVTPPPPPPTTQVWTRVAAEGADFTLPEQATVRYGAGTTFVQLSLAAGTHRCSHFNGGAFQSDPAPGTPKVCDSTGIAAPQPPTLPPPTPTPGSTTYVNPALVPQGAINAGWAERRIATTGEQPGPDAGGIGAARTVCSPSHFNNDDALVYPGQPGRAHTHVYFGNTGANAASTPASILGSGRSTCRGGIVNRSAYWAPAVIDTNTGRPVVPDSENFVYYKTGYYGVRDADVRATPPGFRMIAGDSKSQVPQPHVAKYTCLGVSDSRSTIHSCPPGTQMRMSVHFPQCWDGVQLTSPDHRSHVAYATEGRGCADPRYPVPIFEISMEINYTVPPGGNASWRLSSDINGTPAGSSTHGDWMNGWEQDIMQTWVTRVINPGFSASGGIGDGRALY